MPRSCTACSHEQAGDIAKELAQGVPFSDVAFRFNLKKSSIARHAVNCLHMVRSGKKQVSRAKTPHSVRENDLKRRSYRPASSQRTGRCDACGLSRDEIEPEALLRRAERILWLAETIAARAHAEDDSRLVLQAVDRARAALETMLKATGAIADVNAKIDARSVNVFANLPPRALEELLEILERKPLATSPTLSPVASPGPLH